LGVVRGIPQPDAIGIEEGVQITRPTNEAILARLSCEGAFGTFVGTKVQGKILKVDPETSSG